MTDFLSRCLLFELLCKLGKRKPVRRWFPNHKVVYMETLTIVSRQVPPDSDDSVSLRNLLVVDLISVVPGVLARKDQVFDLLLLIDISQLLETLLGI